MFNRNATMHLSDSLTFLRSRGLFSWLEFDDELNNQEVEIELDPAPAVLEELVRSDYFGKYERGVRRLTVPELSERGVIFYIVHQHGDDVVFVSRDSVQCVHTVARSRLDAIADSHGW